MKKWFERWEAIRSRGQLRYVLLTSLYLSLAIVGGRITGSYLAADKVPFAVIFEQEIYASLIAFVICPILVLGGWYWEESRYQRELKRRKSQ